MTAYTDWMNFNNKKTSSRHDEYLFSKPSTSAIPTKDKRKGTPIFAARTASSRWPTCRASNFPSATIPPANIRVRPLVITTTINLYINTRNTIGTLQAQVKPSFWEIGIFLCALSNKIWMKWPEDWYLLKACLN